MISIRKALDLGTLSRRNAHQVRYGDLVIAPGFNTRDHDPRLLAHIDAIYQFIMSGGKVPELEVILLDDGKAQVVDGHCRHAAIGRAIEAKGPVFDKDGVAWVSVKVFEGDEADQKARIATSNEGLELTPLQRARVYKFLRDQHGLGPEAIGVKVNRTRQHVDQLLHLADASLEVQQMVADGAVSATEAIKTARTHGDKAEGILRDAATRAGKVTAAALRPYSPPAKLAAPMLQHTKTLLAKLPPAVLKRAGHVGTFQDSPDEVVSVDISMRDLFLLVQNVEVIEEARLAAEERQRNKAAKAAQQELTDSGG